MADDKSIKDAAGTNFTGAFDELSSGAYSPKVTQLDGSGSPDPIDPRTGNVAHDAVDSGNPNKVGGKSAVHGASPTAVAAGDRTDWYFNRHGIPFVIGGHMNPFARAHLIADADGAQTNAALHSVATGSKIAITRLTVIVDNAVTVDVSVTIGFAAATLNTPDLSGENQVLLNASLGGGAGVTIGDGSGILGIGGDDEDLRITCGDPTSGNLRVSYTGFVIES